MKVIGVLLRYNHLSDNRCINYIPDRLRRTLQSAGAYVFPIAPVQDVNYMDTKGNEFNELTEYEKEVIEFSLDKVDGILFPGGIKFTPYDRYIFERCIDRHIPVLCICLGFQLMSCYNMDIELNKIEGDINHKQEDDNSLTHKVRIVKNTRLYDIIGSEEISVNSFHNYTVTSNDKFIINAYGEDGIIEGFELDSDFFCMGIQWHPEISYEFDDNSKKIIDAFIDAC